MVFKTICVGSIPATLVIVSVKLFLRKKKKTGTKSNRGKIKQLRRKFNNICASPWLNKNNFLNKLLKSSRRASLSYRKSRRLKSIKRRTPKTFKFWGRLNLYRKLSDSDKLTRHYINTPNKLKNTLKINNFLSPRALGKARLPKAVNIPYAASTSRSSTRYRKKKFRHTSALYTLKTSQRHPLLLNLFKSKVLTRPRQFSSRLNRLKRSIFYKKVTKSKRSQTTRSYKLGYDESYSLFFSKDYKLVLKSPLQAKSYLHFVTYSFVQTVSTFHFLKEYGNHFYTNSIYAFQTKNILPGAFSSIKLVDSTYSQQLRNVLFLNRSNPWLKNVIHPYEGSRYTKNLLMPLNLNPLKERDSILQNWCLESDFVRRKNLKAPNAVFVLGKAPTYRMSKKSESPISTSQQNGNFFNSWGRISRQSSTPLPLFMKSIALPLITKLNRPKPSIDLKNLFSSTHLFINSSLVTQRRLSLRELTHVRPTNFNALQNLAHPSTKGYSRFIMNMKQFTVRPRKKIKGRIRAQYKPLRKQRLLFTSLRLSKRRQLRMKKMLKRNLKRSNRFYRWKTKKASFFFTKFVKMTRVRRRHLKNLHLYTSISSRSTKYGSFNTNIKTPATQMPDFTDHGSAFTGLLSSLSVASTLTHTQTSLLLLTNPLLLKVSTFPLKSAEGYKEISHLSKYLSTTTQSDKLGISNLVPHKVFNKVFSKKVLNSFANRLFRDDIIPLYQNTLIRFIEFCTGKKAMFQFYPFVNQHIDKSYMVRYKRWLPRMGFYERRLGHRFFLEESLHIIHISFILRDPKIIASWLRAMILRISFWKTRSIFRFLKYLFHNYFIHVFDDIKIKGLKIRLKGKISAAGNSRKRTILYRIGNTSHSEVNLRVVKDFSLINTFTGVMGFQVYLFY